MADTNTGPLAGCRVLELGSMLAGPFCGRLLADFGAEVIKVEALDGDPMRSMGPHQDGESLYAASVMRNKRLLSLDLNSADGRQIVRRLVPHCDFVVENFRPGRLEQWGLGYDELQAINPRIVLVRVSGFGQTGPYRERPGFGVIGEAISGLRDLTGDPDRAPPRVAVSLTDYIAGLYAAFGAVLALHARERTGRGQVVDATLFESAFSFVEQHVPGYSNLGKIATRAGSRLPGTAPNNLYEGRDGYIHIAAFGEGIFARLAQAMGRPELVDDPRFATALSRSRHVDAIDDIVGEWTAKFDVKEIEARLVAAEVPVARIYSIKDIFEDPHFQAREMLVPMPHEQLGTVTVAGIVPKLSLTPGSIRWIGRAVGADTESILRTALDMPAGEIDALEQRGAVRRRQPK